MDLTAFFKASYGLYVVSSRNAEGKDCGCVINTFTQVTAVPEQAIIAIHKDNYTTKAIEESGVFTVAVLTQQATMELIGRFGFQSSRDIEKFDGVASEVDANGVRYLTESTAAYFSCRVLQKMDLGTHYLFFARVEDAQNLSKDEVMTYSYYHAVKKGLTPPKASSYQADTAAPKASGKKKFRCKVCGYTVEADSLPDDFVCPICKKGREYFEEVIE